ncbi:MAG: hypothetical protein HZA17_04210 [Nitrospirae bacterium]|nr:hypothetical protein [Nitrospirota bacterium]
MKIDIRNGFIRNAVLLLVIGIGLLACGKKEVKQVSPESKTTTEAFALSETLRISFIKNDRAALQKNSTEDGLRNLSANKKPFDAVELSFTPRWVELEGNQILVNITWKSVWTAAGKNFSDRGMAVFVMEGRPLKLSKILRSNPFIFPEQ